MDRGRRFYNGDDSDLEAELDPAYYRAEEYGTPPTRLTKSSKPQRLPPGLSRTRLTQSKSKDSLRSQDGKKYGKNLSKRHSRKAGKGGDAARKKIQNARLYKELNTTFQVLGIDAYLLKKEITASSHIPFTNAASCGTSTFVSESDSEASTYSCSTSVSGLTGRTRRRSIRGGGTQTPLEHVPTPLFEGANKLLEGFSEEFYSNSIPEKVKEAEMRGKEALDALAELEYWDLSHGEHHEKWISTITDSLNEAQHVSREMRFSMPDPVSGSVETINSITEEGERIVAVLGGLIQTLYERIHERAIECALGMVPCFKIRDEVMLKKAFRSTGKLLRSCQYLSESEAQLSMPGVSQFYFCLVMPPHSKGRLQEALRRLLESASSATSAFQSCLLVEDNLTPSAGKSIHEISKASQLLSLCWNGCLDLVSALSGDSELKYAALHQFAKTVSSAAAHASAMQQPYQAGRSLIQKQNVWKRSGSSEDGRKMSDEVVQAHLWLLPCLCELMKAARAVARHLKGHAEDSETDDGTKAVLEGMRLNFYNLMLASTRRMSWLASRPESVARWALERIEGQGSKVLYCVKQYDKGPLAVDVEDLYTQEGRRKYRVLGETTKQLVNRILNVQSCISLRRPRDEPTGNRKHAPHSRSEEKNPTSPTSTVSGHARAADDRRSPTSTQHRKTISQGSSRSGGSGGGLDRRKHSLLTQAVKSSLGGDSTEQADLGMDRQETVAVVRNRGLSPAMFSGASSTRPRLRSLDRVHEEGLDREGGREADRSAELDVFAMDDCGGKNPPEVVETRRKATTTSSLAVKSPFGSSAYQLNILGLAGKGASTGATVKTEKTEGLMESRPPPTSRVEILQSPFARRPSTLGPNPSKPSAMAPPPVATHQECTPSWTARLNNLAGMETPTKSQGPAKKLSYAAALKSSLKKPQQSVASPPNTEGDNLATERGPHETTSTANGDVMERIMSDKLAQYPCGLPDSDVSTSAAGPPCVIAAPRRPGLPMSKMDDTKDIKWDQLTIRSVLDAGSSGQVFGCWWQGCHVAVKVLHQPADLPSQLEFDWEIQMHQRVSFHQNIVQFLGVCKDFHENGNIRGTGLVMELCEIGSLLRLIKEARFFRHLQEQGMLEQAHKRNPGYRLLTNWRRRLTLGQNIACGMRYVHSHNIIHRDLTSYNVVVDHQFRAKVCDFAKSRIAPKTRPVDRSDTIANSPAWSAPEIITGQLYTAQADVFSIGVILWELATLERPWEEQLWNAKHFDFDVMRMVSTGVTLALPEEVEPAFPEWGMLKELILDCWKLKPEERPTMEAVHQRLVAIGEIVDNRLRASIAI